MMNRYEDRQAARKNRLEERAEKARAEADARFSKAHSHVEHIPPGQPILIGHHSERRHRRDLENHDRNMRAGIEAEKKAARLKSRAASVGQGGISSDDPEALTKLREKLAKRMKDQEFMKAANKALRRKDDTGLRDLGLTDDQIAKLRKPDFAGCCGFAPYQLTNNNSGIRRLQKRLADLEKASEAEDKEEAHEGFRLIENTDENRVQFVFDDKPSEDVRAILKAQSFRWSRFNSAWQRQLTNAGRYAAKMAVKQIEALAQQD